MLLLFLLTSHKVGVERGAASERSAEKEQVPSPTYAVDRAVWNSRLDRQKYQLCVNPICNSYVYLAVCLAFKLTQVSVSFLIVLHDGYVLLFFSYDANILAYSHWMKTLFAEYWSKLSSWLYTPYCLWFCPTSFRWDSHLPIVLGDTPPYCITLLLACGPPPPYSCPRSFYPE